MEPVKPDGPKPAGGARPGGCMKKPKAMDDGAKITLSEAEFKEICTKLRSNELQGAAAADALEVAAGLKSASSRAENLRKEVASSRNEDPPEEVPEKKEKKQKKKGAGFAFAEPEEIPESTHQAPEETAPEEPPEEQEKAEVPELNLTPKQNKMRTDLEMWLMDEIPGLFGVDDSEELDEDLQEDGQANKATELIGAGPEKAQSLAEAWLKSAPDEEKKTEFITELLGKVQAICDVGPKKKKKKKAA